MEVPRRMWTGVGVGALAGVLVVGGLVLTRSDDGPPEVALSTGVEGAGGALPDSSTVPAEDLPILPVVEPPTTTSSTAAPALPTVPETTTSTGPQPKGRTKIAESSGSSSAPTPWALFVADDGRRHCVELEVGGKVHRGLLCDAAPTSSPIGTVHVVDVEGPEMAAVAVVRPGITSLDWLYGDTGGRTGSDPSRAGVAYGVVLSGTRGGGPWEVVAYAGEDAIAATTLPPVPRVHPAGSLPLRTGRPYGTWPGYRRAGSTGFYWAGNQEVGFHDGPGGVRCVLYRRLGGDREAMMAEACTAADRAKPIPFATLIASNPQLAPEQFHVLAVSDGPHDAYRCSLPAGRGSCGGGSHTLRDPKGGSRKVIAEFASAATIPAGVNRVTLTFTGGDAPPVSLDVAVPR